jgi:hypothetical protein
MTPEELERMASELSALALAVLGVLNRVAAYHRPDVWQGLRADRFGQELADQRLRVKAAAAELGDGARLLRARADLVRALTAAAP